MIRTIRELTDEDIQKLVETYLKGGQTYNNLYGVFLGYPDCCIQSFGDIAIPYFMRPQLTKDASKQGFLPCESCAKKLLNNEITYDELINPNRMSNVPFTTEDYNEESEITVRQELDFIVNKLEYFSIDKASMKKEWIKLHE